MKNAWKVQDFRLSPIYEQKKNKQGKCIPARESKMGSILIELTKTSL